MCITMQMDDKEASNTESTWRKRVTSSLRLPVSKSETTRNRCQENSLPLDESTKQKGPVNESAVADNLLAFDSNVEAPETETDDNDDIENGTANENYIRLADDEDQSWTDCKYEIDKREKSWDNFDTSNNSQTSGTCSHAQVFLQSFSRVSLLASTGWSIKNGTPVFNNFLIGSAVTK